MIRADRKQEEGSHLMDQPVDAYSPKNIAERIDQVGVTKARLPTVPLLALAVLAGAFIGFGAMFFTVVVTGSNWGFGPTRLLGGVAFSLGLILVVVGGAELFTGNNLLAMAWADKKITTGQLLRNWVLVFLGNFIGAVATAFMLVHSGTLDIGGGAVLGTAINIAQAKVAIPPVEAFIRGVLCNALVCLAIWLSFAAHQVPGKVIAILFPITAFVALGFEHSIANLYFLPVAWFAGAEGINLSSALGNLLPVTLGNIVGGSLFVALVYWMIYLRQPGSGN